MSDKVRVAVSVRALSGAVSTLGALEFSRVPCAGEFIRNGTQTLLVLQVAHDPQSEDAAANVVCSEVPGGYIAG